MKTSCGSATQRATTLATQIAAPHNTPPAMTRRARRILEPAALARTVANRLQRRVRPAKQRQQQVRERRAIGIPQMLAAAQLPAAAADDRQWQREVIVRIAIAHVAAVQDERAIENRTVAVRLRRERLNERRE